MRMPLDVQRAFDVGFGRGHKFLLSPDHKTRVQGRPSRQFNQIAAQHQRGRGMVAALLVVARPPPDLAETGPPVEPPRRLVVLVHFEEHRVRAQGRRAAADAG
jgi:hypothetical protein